jgi:predicted ATPase
MKEAQELLRLADARGSTIFSASATGLYGWVIAKEGRVQDGLLEMRRVLAAQTEAGWSSPTFGWGSLAEVYGMAGETSVGLELIEKALEQLSRTGEGIWEAELRRLKGELLLTENWRKRHEAEQCFRKAITIAQRQQAKWWGLRATLSLARLLMKQNRRDEAHSMLAEIYDWFTEGFDTADLKDAKTLLDELSDSSAVGAIIVASRAWRDSV